VNAARIADQIAQVDRDLAEVDEQVALGELDEPTAERLRVAYRMERSDLEAKLDAAEPVREAEETGTASKPATTRSKSRAIIGTAVVGVAVVAVAFVAVFSLQDRTPAAESTDGVATAVLEGGGATQGQAMGSVPIEQMEQVVADNPDVTAMRMALADRYLEAGDSSKALEHYMIVLDQEPENSTALARVGWLTYLSGDSEHAEPYLVRAVEIEPEFPQAYWFLANVRMDLGNTAGAVEPLERLLTFDIPIDVRTEAESMLKQAQS